MGPKIEPPSGRGLPYYRVSTDEQDIGLKSQADICAAFADRSGLTLTDPFIDRGISGAAPVDKRPSLIGAIGQLVAGDVLLVAKRDRLGRDPMVVAMIEAAVARKRARIVSASGEGTEGDEPSNLLMRHMVDGFAMYERLIIKTRTRSALAAKALRGERCGNLPLGRSIDPTDPRRSKKRELPIGLVENPAEVEAVRLIHRLHADGKSLGLIAGFLDFSGIPAKQGGRWSRSTVSRVLSRPCP